MNKAKRRRFIWASITVAVGLVYIFLNREIVEVLDDASVHTQLNEITTKQNLINEKPKSTEIVKISKGFFIGSDKGRVQLALGEPTNIEDKFLNQWYYGESIIYFDRDDLVIGYEDIGELTSGLDNYFNVNFGEKTNEIMFIGSNKEQIMKTLGAPSYIDYLHPEIWKYNNSTIHFTSKDIVDGYLNYYGEISIYLPSSSESDTTIGIGSSKDEFLEAIGAPTSIESYHPDIWIYKLAKVFFDEGGYIIEIEDSYNDLEIKSNK